MTSGEAVLDPAIPDSRLARACQVATLVISTSPCLGMLSESPICLTHLLAILGTASDVATRRLACRGYGMLIAVARQRSSDCILPS